MTKDIKIDESFAWRLFLFVVFAAMFFSISDNAFAASEDPIGESLCNVIAILQGTTAKAIAITAIIGACGGLFIGKLQWPTVLIIFTGVICIFSAPTIVDMISSTASQAQCEASTGT
ncbi:MAG: TrbC/VirB2 family protein [Rickettsiaceae bacterium]|nr:TrbC/VirB2 family protein [Rickettsiaceae bacterium]